MNDAGDLEWINDFVGVPYRDNGRGRNGWDCWGLVMAVYRERLGVELPDWQWQEPFGISQKFRAFGGALESVDLGQLACRIEQPEPWALALAHHRAAPHHVGVVAGLDSVLHARRYGGTVYEPVARFAHGQGVTLWKWRA